MSHDFLEKGERECERCRHSFPTARSRCPSCGAWNTYTHARGLAPSNDDGTVLLSDVKDETYQRLATGPWDSLFGSHVDAEGVTREGVVTDSVTLIGGVPGAGKSTLALQMAAAIAHVSWLTALTTKTEPRCVLYFAAEESAGAIRGRAVRLGLSHLDLIRLVPLSTAVDLSRVLHTRIPAAIIGDSVQKIAPSQDQAVTFCETLKSYCAQYHMPALLISHVTKGQELAGLMQLQHAVDMTALFTVYPDQVRELQSIKNRNGPAGLRVLFDMGERGLTVRAETADDDNDDENDDENDADDDADDDARG